METHRLASGAGDTFGAMGGEDVAVYRQLADELIERRDLEPQGVLYNPYEWFEVETPVLGLVRNGEIIASALPGDNLEVVLPETGFYIAAGGQVEDTGTIQSTEEPGWEILVTDLRKPAAGIITHVGKVLNGEPRVGDIAIARIDKARRRDIMRNHTATHLLHAALHAILGDHARQAGSLVAPDRLRFDFTHPKPVTSAELEHIEAYVNDAILENLELKINFKPLQQAVNEGAIALFGEKYEETVRNITIGEPEIFSNELCGGTHVDETGAIGLFLITSEGSAAAGIRRIEAITGRFAYNLVVKRFKELKESADLVGSTRDDLNRQNR